MVAGELAPVDARGEKAPEMRLGDVCAGLAARPALVMTAGAEDSRDNCGGTWTPSERFAVVYESSR